MRVPKWLATCSTTSSCATAASTAVSLPSNKPPSTSTATPSSSSSSSDISSLSLESSIQTLPSIPSLQKLTLVETINLSVSYESALSFKPFSKVPITCLAVHGTFLYAASSSSSINVYDSTTFALLNSFNNAPENPSSGSVKSVTFCNGKILTAHQDSKIRVWKILTPLKQHKLVSVLPTVGDRLRHFLLPKNYVTIRRHKKRIWIEHADAVTGLAINNRLNLIYSVSWDKTLKVWDATASDHRCLESVDAHEDAVNAVAVAIDGTVYTGSADCKIRVWRREILYPQGSNNNSSHVLVATLEKHKSAVNALALNCDGSVLFSGACDRSILVWEREDSANYMAVTGALRGHERAVLCLVNVSGLLLSGSADRTVRIWTRGMDGRYCCLGVLDGHRKPVKSVAGVWEKNSSGRGDGVVSVFSGSLDGEIKVWRIEMSSTDVLKLTL